jgi:hexosaminidase
MKKHFKALTLIILILNALCGHAETKKGKPIHSIIPAPVSYISSKGKFSIRPGTAILINSSSKELSKLAATLNEVLINYGISPLPVTTLQENKQPANSILLSVDNYNEISSAEGYILEVSKKTITLRATTGKGIFYGLQSLLQLMPVQDNNKSGLSSVKIPACKIIDYPRFPYRGMHLDVGRHMFPVEFIKKYIDLMSMYKVNNFHWHLTEDQGWRLEIRKYPQLTETGAFRRSSPIGRNAGDDNIFYGGFYTQEEAREIVEYAAGRYVNVIPEIEMPGHALAALASYPHLGCTGGPYEVWTMWGVHDDIFCAGNEGVFHFLEDVLTEVMDIFPSKYIHIGGDEAPKTRWDVCEKCQQRIKEEKLKDSHELQSYFITRIEKFLNKHGRQIIGWDEILEGGLAPGATVMSWRGTEGGIAAAKMGHDVIMTPGSHCYLDHYQANPAGEPFAIGGFTTLKKTYSFEPVPDVLSEKESRHIMGAQGNVWTEYIKTPAHVEYMAYPRAIALAEVNWSPRESRNWENFVGRLVVNMKRLDLKNVNYSKSAFGVDVGMQYDENSEKLKAVLKSDLPGAEILYTITDKNGTSSERSYKAPFEINAVSIIKAWLSDRSGLPLKISERKVWHNDAFGIKPLLNTLYDHRYQANGNTSLTDGLRGDANSLTNDWLGFLGEDADLIIDLGGEKDIQNVSIGLLHNPGNWIFIPAAVEIKFSEDGIKYTEAGGIKPDIITPSEPGGILYSIINIQQKARYIHIKAKNIGNCPKGHPGEGSKAWLFVDEVLINTGL